VQKAVPLQSDIYNILINNNYNNFTITEFRDELVNCSSTFTDKNMARKFIYRQVYKLLNKGLLIKIKNSGDKKARDIKSEIFQATSFKIKTLIKVPSSFSTKNKDPLSSSSSLEEEKSKLQQQLAISISEADVYSELLIRLPAQKPHLKKFQSEANSISIGLMGRINALEKVLNVMN
jgi:hypothetical protein